MNRTASPLPTGHPHGNDAPPTGPRADRTPFPAAPAAVAALVVVPVIGLFVAFEVLGQLDLLERALSQPGAVGTAEIVRTHLGYAVLATVFLVAGLAAVFDELLARRGPAVRDAAQEADRARREGAQAALRAVELELERLGARGSAPPAAWRAAVARARAELGLDAGAAPAPSAGAEDVGVPVTLQHGRRIP
ncbi:hypothetical protein [Deferrisoma palaeochoriense]